MADLWGSDRPEFIERVASLAGGTTYRTPSGGRSTGESMPNVHAVAAALAFARQGRDDIGPDVAYCWVLRSDAYRNTVIRRLSVALQCHELRSVAAYRLHAAEQAWGAMIHDMAGTRPVSAPKAYDKMLLAACGTLHGSAWDALARAERAYHREALDTA